MVTLRANQLVGRRSVIRCLSPILNTSISRKFVYLHQNINEPSVFRRFRKLPRIDNSDTSNRSGYADFPAKNVLISDTMFSICFFDISG